MTTRTSEAARRLGIHPSHIFQHVAELGAELTFADVWPLIDEDWVETVSAFGHRVVPPTAAPSAAAAAGAVRTPTHGLSDEAVRVLDKLSRHKKWGNVFVAFDALQNLTRLPKRDLEEAVAELRRRGLLDHDGSGRGTISLNSGKRNEIETIAHKERGLASGVG
jgi:hypothetical protein